MFSCLANTFCSNRGNCDFSTGLCQCYEGFDGLSCSTFEYLYQFPSANPVGLQISESRLDYVGNLLELTSSRESSPDFYFIQMAAGQGSDSRFSVSGDGMVTFQAIRAINSGGQSVLSGGLMVDNGGFTIQQDGLVVESDSTIQSVGIFTSFDPNPSNNTVLLIDTIATNPSSFNL